MIDTSFMQGEACTQNIKTFHELSCSRRTDTSTPVTYTVSEKSTAGSISAVDFDALKDKWYKMPEKEYAGRPCSADALYCKADSIFLIEFKTRKLAHALRKVYDSALMLIENFNIKVQQIRKNATYIVVASKWSPKTDCDESISRASQLLTKQPWRDSAMMHNNDLKAMGLANLDGVVVANVYGLSPEEFDNLVSQEGWT